MWDGGMVCSKTESLSIKTEQPISQQRHDKFHDKLGLHSGFDIRTSHRGGHRHRHRPSMSDPGPVGVCKQARRKAHQIFNSKIT